ncbi:MAG: hypothetical protein M3Y48_03615 [Actinomycetota bacterium]|nr:hypothetical protein [Actinomycetota bacterium]
MATPDRVRAPDLVLRPARSAGGSAAPWKRRAIGASWPWWVVAAVLAAAGRRRGRRAALRGIGSVLAAEALVRRVAVDGGTHRWRRAVEHLPLRLPSSSGPPSLYAASAVAFAVSVGTTEPVLGLPMAGLAAVLLRHRLLAGAVCGGDGTVAAAARVAIDADLPLLVFPGGTFNHFAADIGIDRVSDALAALRHGTAIRIDVALAGERLFLNTSSLGSYPAFVAIRERWEGRVGKPVAAAIALLIAVRRQKPVRLVVDGHARDVVMMFVGNCRYQPHGFAPSWRPRLDDGVLDLRMVTVDGPAPLLRLALAMLTGRLGRSRLYIEDDPVDLHISMPDGAAEVAWDGEIGPGNAEIEYTKLRRSLTVYQPPDANLFPR